MRSKAVKGLRVMVIVFVRGVCPILHTGQISSITEDDRVMVSFDQEVNMPYTGSPVVVCELSFKISDPNLFSVEEARLLRDESEAVAWFEGYLRHPRTIALLSRLLRFHFLKQSVLHSEETLKRIAA